MAVHVTYNLLCNFCKLLSPDFTDMDHGPSGWSGDGNVHFCCKEHQRYWDAGIDRPVGQVIDIQGIVQGDIERSHQTLESYIKFYLETTHKKPEDLVLVEQRSYEDSKVFTVRWWLEPKEK